VGLAGCSDRKKNIKQFEDNQLSACEISKLETAMSSRFAKLHGNNSNEGGRNVDRGVAHTVLRIEHAGGKRSCRSLLAEQTRVRDRGNGFIDHQNRFFYSRVSILHTGRASKSSLFAARKYTLSNVKIGTSSGVAVAQIEGSRKCNLRVARTQIAELMFVSTAVPVLRRVAPKNHATM